MSKLYLGLLTLLLLQSPSPKSDDTWVRLEPEGVGFVVMMPSKPDEEVSRTAKLTTHAFFAKTDKSVYVASYGDYIPSVQVNPVEELPASRDSFNKELKANLVNSRDISLSGISGIEFRSETESGVIRSKIFVRDHRVFQIAVIVSKDVDQSKMIQTFLDSFSFTTKQ